MVLMSAPHSPLEENSSHEAWRLWWVSLFLPYAEAAQEGNPLRKISTKAGWSDPLVASASGV
jgi:hypothetical protein